MKWKFWKVFFNTDGYIFSKHKIVGIFILYVTLWTLPPIINDWIGLDWLITNQFVNARYSNTTNHNTYRHQRSLRQLPLLQYLLIWIFPSFWVFSVSLQHASELPNIVIMEDPARYPNVNGMEKKRGKFFFLTIWHSQLYRSIHRKRAKVERGAFFLRKHLTMLLRMWLEAHSLSLW